MAASAWQPVVNGHRRLQAGAASVGKVAGTRTILWQWTAKFGCYGLMGTTSVVACTATLATVQLIAAGL
jgi:hypothetical protein